MGEGPDCANRGVYSVNEKDFRGELFGLIYRARDDHVRT